LVKHKSEEPIMHPAACRVCGEDFGSISGMKRHLAMVREAAMVLTISHILIFNSHTQSIRTCLVSAAERRFLAPQR
jgi:hypothetical protein